MIRRSQLSLICLLTSVVSFAAGQDSIPEIYKPKNFVKNIGQWDQQVQYKSYTSNSNVSFLENGLSFSSQRVTEGDMPCEGSECEQRELLVWNLSFDAASGDEIIPQNEENGVVSYIKGNKKENHFIDVPESDGLTYTKLYENIDLVYYFSNADLKYDFVLKPGANSNDISMSYHGVKSIGVSRSGELEVNTEWGTLLEQAPYSYQMIDGQVVEVQVAYKITGERSFGFEILEDYNEDYPLIIDPIILNYSTFVTTSQADGIGYIYDIITDANKNVYATGYYIDDLPVTPGVYSEVFNNMWDVFVLKLNPTGTGLIWATYIGGTGQEAGYGIRRDQNGNIFVGGQTRSSNFPMAGNPVQSSRNGIADYFILKLSGNGKQLLTSTYFGGGSNETMASAFWNFQNGMEISSAGEPIFYGSTFSSDFPTSNNAFQKNPGGGGDVVLFKLNSTLSNVAFSTYIGGSSDDKGFGITQDATGNIYMVGYTGRVGATSNNFPTVPGSFKTNYTGNRDGFALKLNPDGSQLMYSTYLSGSSVSSEDIISALDINDSGELIVAGTTLDPTFPTVLPFDGFGSVANKGFITKFDVNGNSILFSSFYGGNLGNDYINEIVAGVNNKLYLSGTTESTDFPTTTCAIDNSYDGSMEAFFSVVSLDQTGIDYSTLLGGSTRDYKTDLEARDGSCYLEEVWVSLTSHSFDFPTTANAFSAKINREGQDADFGSEDTPVILNIKRQGTNDQTIDFDYAAQSCGTNVQFTDLSSGTGTCSNWRTQQWEPDAWLWDFGNGNTSTEQNPEFDFSGLGDYTVKLTTGCPSKTITKTISITGTGGGVNLGEDKSICGTINETLGTGGGSGVTYLWSTGATTETITVTTPGTFWVSVIDGSCESRDTLLIEQSPGPEVEPIVETTGACDRFGSTIGQITANASGGVEPYTYLWDDDLNQTTQTAVGLTQGLYSVTVTDAEGCSVISSAAIEKKIKVNYTIDVEPCESCSDGVVTVNVTGTGITPYTYRWDDDSEQTTQTATGLSQGVYTVTVTDSNGCFTQEKVYLGIVGIDNPEWVKNIKVYPNPTTGLVSLRYGSEVEAVQIYNGVGKRVAFQSSSGSLDLSNIGVGIYYIVFEGEGITHTKRLMVLN